MRRLTMLLALPTLLLAAACGDDGGDSSDAAVTTAAEPVGPVGDAACPLDAFMVNAVTGLEVGEPDPVIQTGDGVSCTFGDASGDTGMGVTTYTSTGEAAMESARGLFDDAEEVTLEFADAAIWSPSMTTLHVVAGSGGVQLQITDFAGAIDDPLQVATELAELALG